MIIFIIFLCASFYVAAMEKISLAQVSQNTASQRTDLFELIQSEAIKSEDSAEVLNTINTILKSTKLCTFRDLKNNEIVEKHILNVLSTIKILCESYDLANYNYDRCLLIKYLRERLRKNAQKFIIDRISEDNLINLEKIPETQLQIFICIILAKLKARGPVSLSKDDPSWKCPELVAICAVYTLYTIYFAVFAIAIHFWGSTKVQVAMLAFTLCSVLWCKYYDRKEAAAQRAYHERKLKLRERISEKAANNKSVKVKSALFFADRDQSTKIDAASIVFRSPHQSAEADPQWCLVINGECMDTFLTAHMLEQIEQYSQRPIYELFDYVFASSMASLLALGVTASLDGEKPLISTGQLIDLLQRAANTFMPTDTPAIRQKKIYQMLPLLTCRAKLSHCLTKVVVPYVEQKIHTSGQSTHCYFDRSRAQTSDKKDILIEEAIKSSIGDNAFLAALVDSERNIQRRASNKYKNDAAAFLVEMNLFSDDLPNRFFIVVLSTGLVNDNNSSTHEVLRKKLGLGFKTIKPAIAPQDVTDCSPSVLASYKKAGEEAVKGSIDVIRLLVANYERKKSLISYE